MTSSPFTVIQTVEEAVADIIGAAAARAESDIRKVYTITGHVALLDWVRKIAQKTPCARVMYDGRNSTAEKIRVAVVIYTEQAAETASSLPTINTCDAVYRQLMGDRTLGGVLIEPFTLAGYELYTVDDKRRDETVIALDISAGFVDDDGHVQPAKRLFIREYEEGASDYTELEGWTQLGTGRIEHGYTDNPPRPLPSQTDGMPHADLNVEFPSRSPILTRAYLPMNSLANLGYALKRPVIDGVVDFWRSAVESRYWSVLFKWRVSSDLDLVLYWPKAGEGEAQPEITAADGCPVLFHVVSDPTVPASKQLGYAAAEAVS